MRHPRFAAALLVLFCASNLFPQGAGQLDQLVEEGDKALSEHRYADAETAYEKVRSLQPAVAEIHAKLGVAYFQEGKFEQAASALRQALKLKPGLPRADTLLAMSLSELGRYSEALPGLEKSFRKSSDPALKRMTGLQLERTYTGLAQDEKAAEVALELNRLFPDDPEILYHTGRILGNFTFLTMQKLSKVAPSSVWRYQAAGEAYESQGDFDLAILQYRKVLELDPSRRGIHFRLGRALALRAQKASAGVNADAEIAREYEQELELDPTNANAAYELGELNRKSRQLEKARSLFAAAVKYDPDFDEAQIGLGRVLAALGQPSQALEHLRKAVSLNPRSGVAYYQLARIEGALGHAAEQQKALAEYQRLRDQQAVEENRAIFSGRAATKQQIESEAAQ
jgi:tetratricopeptide (TPR) repeat protein